MRALTIKQPWGSLIVRGGKTIENRDWRTHVRGIIAVHVSQKMHQADMDDACGLMAGFVPKFSAQRFQKDIFPVGSILGTVEIVDCVTQSDSPWFVGDFGFVLANPVACKGAQGFWNVPEELVVRMREQYWRATK